MEGKKAQIFADIENQIGKPSTAKEITKSTPT